MTNNEIQELERLLNELPKGAWFVDVEYSNDLNKACLGLFTINDNGLTSRLAGTENADVNNFSVEEVEGGGAYTVVGESRTALEFAARMRNVAVELLSIAKEYNKRKECPECGEQKRQYQLIWFGTTRHEGCIIHMSDSEIAKEREEGTVNYYGPPQDLDQYLLVAYATNYVAFSHLRETYGAQ